jgi:hypothetical protein
MIGSVSDALSGPPCVMTHVKSKLMAVQMIWMKISVSDTVLSYGMVM